MVTRDIVELHKNSTNWAKIVDEIVRLEKKIFPKHESLARSFDEELKKKNCGLLYSVINGEVAGYVMYSWPSSLCALITKLAVKENHRRQGLGEALLRAAIQKCRTRNVHCVSLHVDPLRTSAVTLYKKIGFQVDNMIEALNPWEMIDLQGARNFMLYKKPPLLKSAAEDDIGRSDTSIVGKRSGSWKSWINKSLNLKISSH